MTQRSNKYIEVKGIKYYNDRFYLNDLVGRMQNQKSCDESPPPLLNRSDIIASLDLICVIAGTYTFDPIWLHQELPSLFPEPEYLSNQPYQEYNDNKVVPTLLLHGTNDSTMKKMSQKLNHAKTNHGGIKKMNTDLFGKSVSLSRILPTWIPPSSDNDKYSQEMKDSKSPKRLKGVHHPKYWLLFEKCGSLVVMISTQNLTKPTSVDATWVQRFECNDSYKKKSNTVSFHQQKSLESKMHDSLRNCSNGQDFGWVLMDFLIKSQKAVENSKNLSNEIIIEFIKKHICEITSWEDFAQIYRFQDASVFLVSTVPGYYLGSFHSFQSSMVDQNNQNNHSRNIQKDCQHHTMLCLYGPQRVRDVLHYLQKPMPTSHHHNVIPTFKGKSNKRKRFGQRGIDTWNQSQKISIIKTSAKSMPWLPQSGFMTKDDRLIMQPTSLGGNWTYSSMDQLVRYYLEQCESYNDNYTAKNTTIDENDYLERTDIIWPSFDFIDSCIANEKNSCGEMFEESYTNTCNVFLSSNTFNSISVDCISRMALYENSIPSQLFNSIHFSPHIKSYGRLLSFNSSSDEYSSNNNIKNEEYFAWFMITSACLSKGAQGQPTPDREFESDSFTYSNFELGVLFPSRLQGNSNTDRIYAWKPISYSETKYVPIDDILKVNSNASNRLSLDKDTSLTEAITTIEVIHLPIPYKLKPRLYMDDPEDTDMSHTPYFHEIEPNSEAAGNMRLTPLGKRLSE